MLNFPLGSGVLIRDSKGWFLARVENGAVTVTGEPADQANADFPAPSDTHELGSRMLIGADEGLFQVHVGNGVVTVDRFREADTGAVSRLHDAPGGGVLIGAEKGLFLARLVNDAVIVDRAGKADTGPVLDMHEFPGGGVLIRAEKGLFLARVVNGAVTVDPAGKADTGQVLHLHDVPDGGVLIVADKGWFVAVLTPLQRARVDVRDRKKWDGSPVDANRDLNFVFMIAHGCAPAATTLDLKVRGTAPGSKPVDSRQQLVTPSSAIARGYGAMANRQRWPMVVPGDRDIERLCAPSRRSPKTYLPRSTHPPSGTGAMGWLVGERLRRSVGARQRGAVRTCAALCLGMEARNGRWMGHVGATPCDVADELLPKSPTLDH